MAHPRERTQIKYQVTGENTDNNPVYRLSFNWRDEIKSGISPTNWDNLDRTRDESDPNEFKIEDRINDSISKKNLPSELRRKRKYAKIRISGTGRYIRIGVSGRHTAYEARVGMC